MKTEKKLLELYPKIISHKDGNFINNSCTLDTWEKLNKAFPEYESVLNEYVDLIHSAENKEGIGVFLPPFMVFPTYTSTTIGWRMGLGEWYSEIWHKAIYKLNNKEREDYCSNYDYPKWWISGPLRPRYFTLPWRNKQEIDDLLNKQQ